MNHGVAGYKLGRSASQRKALWRGLITELFRYDRISTTEAKARSMRGDAEHLISLAKRGQAAGGSSTVHARRMAARVITDPEVTRRLFDEIAPRFTDRPGGYTRMIKVGPRLGDSAEMVVLELVEKPAEEQKTTDKKTAPAKKAAPKKKVAPAKK